MIEVFKPYPQWNCPHVWVLVGLPIRTWQSANTGDPPPEECFTTQERYCTICGGYETM